MTKEELFERCLPKWPQMKVSGVPVTKEQALEIIRRTDTFFTWGGGNNHNFNKAVRNELQMPVDKDSAKYKGGYVYDTFEEYWDSREKWDKNWNLIETEYVLNDWISCCFVGGPHGWCHPDGNIGFMDNVGKWPSAEEVYNDWVILASEFPFLDIGVTLMDGESMDDCVSPVVSFIVKNGTVEVVDPDEIDVHANHPEITRCPSDAFDGIYMDGRTHENAIPMATIKEWKRFLKEK